MRFPPLDLDRIETYSIHDRPSKVSRESFARPWEKGGSLAEFAARLPGILAVEDLELAAEAMARAAKEGRTVILAMGGHVVKVGLAPVIIDLMERGVISLVAVNGSVLVHDTEIALAGATSEDVAASLGSGAFGMGRESTALVNQAAHHAAGTGEGLGRSLGKMLVEAGAPFRADSLLARAHELDVPLTAHLALGTDIPHIHPQADGAALGAGSMADFRLFCRAVATLEGGVFINLGSAVIMPEVFLKAVTLARNLGHGLTGMTTLNMDMIRHYRPLTNVVTRPVMNSGKGLNLVGHHEIMLPLLAALVIERL